MEKFASLFKELEQTKSITEKTSLLKNYFETTPSKDAAWALFFLCGNRVKRLITARMLFDWCRDLLKLPDWLMAESYAAVGDISETIALLLLNKSKNNIPSTLSLGDWMESRILPLRDLKPDLIKQEISRYWNELDSIGILLMNKILSGSLRIGVSQMLTLQGLSQAIDVSKEILTQRLMGTWFPSADFFDRLKASQSNAAESNLNPYPFYLASPVKGPLESLGAPEEWLAEWKWDGIRAQCIFRNGQVAIWSRGNELVTDHFPEIEKAIAQTCEDGLVLDGEILAYTNEHPLPFNELQKRLGRKKVSTSLIKKIPLIFMIYDILEYQGQDIRHLPFAERRKLFTSWGGIDPKIKVSPILTFTSWQEVQNKRAEAHENGTEGLILKKKNSHYAVGRRQGHWWKYKLDPKTIDAILLYAQTGQGWRANLYTDYTFGVWNDNAELVPITKAYSGLSQEEIYELDSWIRKNTIEKFGPVRKVKTEQVFEIAFEGIQKSNRHKSGIALRFPRIQRWRKDKPISECDSLASIKQEFFFPISEK